MTGPIDPSKPRGGFIVEAKRRNGTTLLKYASTDDALAEMTAQLLASPGFERVTWKPVDE